MGKKSYTIVIKLGTSSLVDEVTREPKVAGMSRIVETCVGLQRAGHRVVIVSSGGIAVGLKTMGMDSKPKKLSQVQAIAAIGQGKLIARWDSLFKMMDQRIAQILLTRNDISDWTQYKNAQNTINELLGMGVIPIVNENDTLSVTEIKFGDNDTLSAITAALINADYLFLLTDVECLYTDDPRSNPDAKPILMVDDLEALKVKTSSGGSDVGTGGMTTKLIAADLATEAGTTMIIMKSDNPEELMQIVDYIQKNDIDEEVIHEHIEDPEVKLEKQRLILEDMKLHDVPLHTRFLPGDKQVKNREFWMLHSLEPHGALIIDQGAKRALTRSNKAGLLPVGIIQVEGTFHESECVSLKAGHRAANGELDRTKPIENIGRARVNYTSNEIDLIRGCQSNQIEEILGYADSEYVAHRDNLAFPPVVLEKTQSAIQLASQKGIRLDSDGLDQL